MNTRRRLMLDIAMFATLIIANDPSGTGLAAHEWIGVALAGAVVTHLAVNWRRTLRQVAGFLDRLRSGARAGLALDGLLALSAAAVVTTGLAQSHVILPTVGVAPLSGGIVGALHLWSAWASVGLATLHFALHWRWVSAVLGSLSRSARPGKHAAPARRPRLGTGSAIPVAAFAIVMVASIYGGVTAARSVASTAGVAPTTIVATNVTAATSQTDAADAAATGTAGTVTANTADSQTAAGTTAATSQTLTCPRTGCTASTCHHAQ